MPVRMGRLDSRVFNGIRGMMYVSKSRSGNVGDDARGRPCFVWAVPVLVLVLVLVPALSGLSGSSRSSGLFSLQRTADSVEDRRLPNLRWLSLLCLLLLHTCVGGRHVGFHVGLLVRR